jgi:WD40 repeat protein
MARFSPDSRWVAVASEAGAVFFWNTESLSDLDDPIFTVDNLSGPVFGLTFEDSCGSDCEFRLYAGSFGGRITRIELPGQARIATDQVGR